MPDTTANQARNPQLLSQPIRVGSPLARLVGVICLPTGALINAAMGPVTGKGTSELGLLRGLTAAFSPGDVLLADAFYCNYFLIAAMQAAGVMCCLLRMERGSQIFAVASGSEFAIIVSVGRNLKSDLSG
jgi:hypothetical protein